MVAYLDGNEVLLCAGDEYAAVTSYLRSCDKLFTGLQRKASAEGLLSTVDTLADVLLTLANDALLKVCAW